MAQVQAHRRSSGDEHAQPPEHPDPVRADQRQRGSLDPHPLYQQRFPDEQRTRAEQRHAEHHLRRARSVEHGPDAGHHLQRDQAGKDDAKVPQSQR